jgi:UPF0176 protein
MKYINLSAYKFIALPLDTLSLLKEQLAQSASTHAIMGTILLSTEGINLFVAGTPASITQFTDAISSIPAFSDLVYKKSESDDLPFRRMRVRIKKEIIYMNQPDIEPEKETAPYVEPAELKQWYAENRDMVILDTRNTYEFDVGTFDGATHLNIENFSDFPDAVATLPDAMKTKPIVTFCTGGIRCEKAAAYLMKQGFTNVWQLKGGILNYFEQCGDAYFQGNCFVFDARRAVDAGLEEVKN